MKIWKTKFRQKFQKASRIADKLKIALANAYMRKAKQNEIEKKQIQEQQQYMYESIQLQKRSFALQRELENSRKTLLKLGGN